jgi:hypothetical protein
MARGNMKVNMNAFNERKEIKRHKINDGDNLFRMLPPYGEESDGYPYRRWVIAWLADPETGRNRPYASPWSFGEKDCPVGEYVKELQNKRDILEKKLAAKDLSKEEIKEKLKPLAEILWKIKPKATFFYNAVNKSGEVGLLELKKSAHDSLKQAMKEYIADYNQDPTSLNSDADDSGVWFKIKKTGAGMSTEYSVEKSQAKVKDPSTGKISFQDDQSELPASVVENYEDLGNDLFKLYRQISYDDLRTILLFNLGQYYQAFCKEFGQKGADLIKVEGFEFESSDDEVVDKEDEVEAPAPVVKQVSKPSKKPMPKFSDDEEEEDDVFVAPRATAKTQQISKPSFKKPVDSNLFDMADDLLNS